ncbi:MAG TPA: M4 family metallopeptidase [Pyrinomonadaceae bacterium]|nr:M4 family metallopeptidase [Pyrinomonadaceae bacterium]
MKKSIFVIAISLAFVFALALPRHKASAARDKSADKLARSKEIAHNVIAARADKHAIRDAKRALKATRVFADDQEKTHARFQQTYNDVPVFGGEAIVHLNPDDSVFAVTDDLVDAVEVDTVAYRTTDEAVRTAISSLGCEDCLTAPPKADLEILRHNGNDYLTYRVELRREDGTDQTSMPVYFVDAHTGNVVMSYDNLQTASGSSLYSGTVTINTYFRSPTYYMEDVATRKMGTFDFRNTTSSVYRFTDSDNIWNSTTQRAGVDAHYGAGKVYDYYLNTHGRRGIDGAGGPAYFAAADGVTGLISSVVHYGVGYNNAFWNGSYMTYGDGNGSSFSPLVTLDICGHEMTHGVTERTANLAYVNESGALNESMSDVFGAMVERYAQGQTSNTWKIGEQCYTPGIAGDALRYMDNPHAASNSGFTADDDPDHYAERYTGTGDSGGVHINSGIGNKAFYLVAVGGTHHRSGVTVTGIGADAAARIWYRALTTYMTSSTNYKGARTATLNAAAALYGTGSTNYNAVAQAWTACGVV